MDLSATRLWTWMTLSIRDPRSAMSSVKAAQLPMEVSVMMIALAGVFWAVLSGLFLLSVADAQVIVPISETEAMALNPLGPIASGVIAMVAGLGLGYCIFSVGRRSGGQGSLPEIMSLTAVLELVVSILIVAQTFVSMVLPFAGLLLFFLAIFVLVRGLGHVVNEGHDYDDMGKSVGVTLGAFVMLIVLLFVASIILGLMGIGPSGEIVPLPEDLAL